MSFWAQSFPHGEFDPAGGFLDAVGPFPRGPAPAERLQALQQGAVGGRGEGEAVAVRDLETKVSGQQAVASLKLCVAMQQHLAGLPAGKVVGPEAVSWRFPIDARVFHCHIVKPHPAAAVAVDQHFSVPFSSCCPAAEDLLAVLGGKGGWRSMMPHHALSGDLQASAVAQHQVVDVDLRYFKNKLRPAPQLPAAYLLLHDLPHRPEGRVEQEHKSRAVVQVVCHSP
mmetsp:Transcript_5252/g.14670  ORF Transcript_5252/g.14670 Transcript_5252/m.14670 type:complete len:226 (-) Transcript_5252:2241-2918(-)